MKQYLWMPSAAVVIGTLRVNECLTDKLLVVMILIQVTSTLLYGKAKFVY